uniref:Interleukin-2 receptor subunit alpha n=1 Tax=Propithecus coquereli TaxID=379532 RepID=A0A2K6F3F5_PROCO
MEPHLLVWGVITFIMVPCGKAELCDDDPPEVAHATFKALAYKRGTTLNCECQRGYRRIKNGSPYLLCTGNSSHSSWDNKCQCMSTASRHTRGVTPQPEEQKERKVTEMQSQVQPVDQVSLPGEEPSQASPGDLPERETSCPLTTTDPQEHTEAATTMETFVFTTEYQVAVAGCVLLLFTVLLLSGLTWQRRWRKSRRTI